MLHSGSALLCGKVLGRTMHQQDRSTLGKQGCDLLTLNPADLFMIGCNGEDGNFESLTQFAEILNELRQSFKVPIFSITSDHEQIGRIQGQQIAALLPKGGSILLVHGPAENLAAKQRATGMQDAKPANVQVKVIKANWTEASAYKAVSSWLKLSTSQQTVLDAIIAHDDSMALGARKAFQEIHDSALRDRWLAVPFLGIDGMPRTGQADVRRGLLAATIIVPTNTGTGIEMLARALSSGVNPPEKTLTSARSFPPIEDLGKKNIQRAHASGGY